MQPVLSSGNPAGQSTPNSQPRNPHVKFHSPDDFRQSLARRVSEFFEKNRWSQRDCPEMYAKSAVILAVLLGSYATLLLAGPVWWIAVPLAAILGLASAAVGFNIQHDGGHNAFSNHRWINRLAAHTLDLLGGSSYIWARKHNTIHHTYTNVSGHDDDINVGLLGRLAPQQRRLGFHRFQHLYLWFLYGFLTVKWHLIDDFANLVTGRIGEHPITRPRGRDLLTFFGGKALFFSLAFGLPMFFYPWWAVVGLYLVASFVQGVVLSVVFQLAHCVEEAEFPQPRPETARIESSWAVHQVETTVDFAPRNRLLAWFVGGLNFQIEHHLFPQICHVRYPAIAKIVQEVCREYGLAYHVHPTFRAGIASHYRWLRRMGRGEQVAA